MAIAPGDPQNAVIGSLTLESGLFAEMPDQADESVPPTSTQCSTSCHEHCKGFPYCSFVGLSSSRQAPSPGPAKNGFAGLVDKIVPPPQ